MYNVGIKLNSIFYWIKHKCACDFGFRSSNQITKVGRTLGRQLTQIVKFYILVHISAFPPKYRVILDLPKWQRDKTNPKKLPLQWKHRKKNSKWRLKRMLTLKKWVRRRQKLCSWRNNIDIAHAITDDIYLVIRQRKMWFRYLILAQGSVVP